ncbi:transcriptional regulator, LysR family [Duganella sp. CF402]|uniref:LysR family transcriptional regulator n=1 Tax=unclassified Duganella TaxID=2636909 RepID=UPI0008AB2453|nr:MULTISPECIES: LysR family transcriptional regulator [unclassified Duganella]RZT08238.1 LysR family transcriptional regulator [Duganella sp. BK701]SEM01123.1 transcriptional regulator, LysR family [Duganella sp. CF402]
MDVKQLRTLVAIADAGSVTRAAVLLNIVQPAVSRHIKLLEEDLGTVLFDRNRNGMELTDDGRTLLEYARRVLREIEQARAEIRPSRGVVGGIVTIGLLPSTCDLITNVLMREIAAAYPGIHLRFLVGYAGDLQKWLDAGDLDASLLYDISGTPALKVRPLLEEALWVVDRPGNLVAQDVPVAFASLAEQPLILPDARHGLRALVDHQAALAGVRLRIAAETNAMSVQKSLVVGGHGMTILPSVAVVDEVARGILVCAPLVAPQVLRKIVLAMPTNRLAGTPVRMVVATLLTSIQALIDGGYWKSANWLDSDPL